MNMRPGAPERPFRLAMMLPLPGADSSVSLSTPSSASQSRMYSQTAVSFPVGMNPVLTDGMRTRSCSRRTMSSHAASTSASSSSRVGILKASKNRCGILYKVRLGRS